MKISAFKTNQALEINGVWHTIGGSIEKPAKVLVARDNNAEYVKELRKEMAPYQSRAQRANLSEDYADKILCKVMAKTILLDWDNIEDDDGSSIPYNYDNAIRLLTIQDFRAMIITLSSNMDYYRTTQIQEVAEDIKK